MTRVKGPWFPSFAEPPREKDDTHKRYNFKAGTQSTRQQKRNLRTRVRKIIDSTDESIVAVGDRVIRSVCQEPDPEFSSLHLYCAALTMSEESGESWLTCMTYLMDRFEADQKAAESHAEEQPEARGIGATLGHFLRKIVASAFRARHEEAPTGDVDQPNRSGFDELP